MKGMITNMTKEYNISFKCYGNTFIQAESEQEAKEKFYENYVPTIDDIWDMKITDIEISQEG